MPWQVLRMVSNIPMCTAMPCHDCMDAVCVVWLVELYPPVQSVCVCVCATNMRRSTWGFMHGLTRPCDCIEWMSNCARHMHTQQHNFTVGGAVGKIVCTMNALMTVSIRLLSLSLMHTVHTLSYSWCFVCLSLADDWRWLTATPPHIFFLARSSNAHCQCVLCAVHMYSYVCVRTGRMRSSYCINSLGQPRFFVHHRHCSHLVVLTFRFRSHLCGAFGYFVCRSVGRLCAREIMLILSSYVCQCLSIRLLWIVFYDCVSEHLMTSGLITSDEH